MGTIKPLEQEREHLLQNSRILNTTQKSDTDWRTKHSCKTLRFTERKPTKGGVRSGWEGTPDSEEWNRIVKQMWYSVSFRYTPFLCILLHRYLVLAVGTSIHHCTAIITTTLNTSVWSLERVSRTKTKRLIQNTMNTSRRRFILPWHYSIHRNESQETDPSRILVRGRKNTTYIGPPEIQRIWLDKNEVCQSGSVLMAALTVTFDWYVAGRESISLLFTFTILILIWVRIIRWLWVWSPTSLVEAPP